MLLATLNSSNLRAASFEPWSATLTIEFRNGSIYEYTNVPPVIYDRLFASDSPGRFHHENIKDRFRFRRIA
jgi:hypothetical protein